MRNIYYNKHSKIFEIGSVSQSKPNIDMFMGLSDNCFIKELHKCFYNILIGNDVDTLDDDKISKDLI